MTDLRRVPEEGPPDDAVVASRARAAGLAHWSLTGFVLGGLGPGLMSPAMLPGDPEYLLFVLGSLVFGVGFGVIAGALAPAWRMARSSPTPEDATNRALGCGCVLGPLWAGGAGALGGALMLGLPGLDLEGIPIGAFVGGAIATVVGTPAVVTFVTMRTSALKRGRPTWPALVVSVGMLVLTVGAVLLLLTR